ncbi:MAG: tetratricopeptide repeat protein [Bacteroidales bacterium]|jgi:tetratricopeptide (TPR) repeat protein|nr:tetratricopeptide repeat protein [Bacteroidales bacterium]
MKIKNLLYFIIGLVIITSSCSVQNTTQTDLKKVTKELNDNEELEYYYIFMEANRKKLLGDLNAALALFYQCLEIKPQSAAAMSEISQINEIIDNNEVAVKYAQNAARLDPDNKWFQLKLARLYINNQQYQKAINVYQELYETYPQDLEIPYNLAALFRQTNQLQKAIDLYNDIENQTGINETLSIIKQRLYLQQGQKNKAYEEIKNLINHFPNQPQYYGILAEMYTNDNLFTKAEENYKKLFAIDSTNTLGQLSIIDFYRKKMDYDNAFKYIHKVLHNENIDFQAKAMVFISLLNNSQELNIYFQQIEDHLLLFRQLYPDKKESHTLYADYLIRMNQLDKARTELQMIVEKFSVNQAVWEQLLSLYSYQNKFKKLYDVSSTAIDSFPQHALFYLFKGVSASQIEEYDTALQAFKNGLKYVENNTDLEYDFYTYLAENYHETKDYDKSDYYFEMVIKSDYADLYVFNNYAYYLSLREVKLDYAQELSRKTIEAEPENSTYLDTYAWILFKQQKYQDALFYIQKAYDLGGFESPAIVHHFGDILYFTGDTAKAIKMWKLANDLGDTSNELLFKIEKGKIQE